MTFDSSTGQTRHGRRSVSSSSHFSDEPFFQELDETGSQPPAAEKTPPPIDETAIIQNTVIVKHPAPVNETDSAETTDPADNAGSAPPGWFSRRKAKSAEASARRRSPVIRPRPEDRARTMWQEPTLLEKLTYLVRGRPLAARSAQQAETVENPKYRQFKRLLAFAATGYGLSVILHTLLTAALALVVFEQVRSDQLTLLLSDSDSELVELQQIDTRLDSAGGAEAELELPQLEPVDIASTELVSPADPTDLKPALPALGSGEGTKEGDGSGLAFAMPDSGEVVTKGSFSVWTVPEDPAPGQNYNIIIQVRLPENTRRYNSRDLFYKVTGTDGYQQPPPGVRPRHRWLKVKDDVTQLAIWVPAAGRLVKDTIRVRSRILKEEQELVIEF